MDENTHTRRAALMIAGAALPLMAAADTAHPVVHFEIGCRDLGKTEQFFGDLFGWKTQRNGIASDIDVGSQAGVPGHMTMLGHEPQHYTIFYVEVNDVQAYLDKAAKLGGKTLVPPVKFPLGTFAWFSDIDGNTIGLLKKA